MINPTSSAQIKNLRHGIWFPRRRVEVLPDSQLAEESERLGLSSSYAARRAGAAARARWMAEQLSVSQDTIKHHIQHIYNKIGVSTRAGATLFAMEQSLV